MATSKSMAVLIAFLTGIALTVVIAWLLSLGFNPDTPVTLAGSCTNENRPTDQTKCATLISASEGVSMINAFGNRFYGAEFTAVTDAAATSTTRSRISSVPTQRVGAFISKYMLDAIFDKDLQANGVMCYIGSATGTDGTDKLQFVLTPAKKQGSSAPDMPSDGTQMVFRIADESWCPTNCNDID